MNFRNQFFDRWKSDYDFKTILTAFGSFSVTIIFALYNGFFGVYRSSLWHGAICLYYLILATIRGYIVFSEKKISLHNDREQRRNKVYIISSLLLLILNISLIIPVSLMVKQQKPVNMTLIPAITMAAYTTYKIIMTSVNLKKRKQSSNRLIHLLRTINFIDALVSILTLQNTLIMVNLAGDGTEMLSLSAPVSALVMTVILILSVHAMVSGIVRLKNNK